MSSQNEYLKEAFIRRIVQSDSYRSYSASRRRQETFIGLRDQQNEQEALRQQSELEAAQERLSAREWLEEYEERQKETTKLRKRTQLQLYRDLEEQVRAKKLREANDKLEMQQSELQLLSIRQKNNPTALRKLYKKLYESGISARTRYFDTRKYDLDRYYIDSLPEIY